MELDDVSLLSIDATNPPDTETVATEPKPKKNKNRLSRIKWKKRRLKKLYTRKQRRALMENPPKPIVHPPEEHSLKAREYLHNWYEDRENWRFKKVQQTWLLKHAFDETVLSAEDFRIFRRYVKNIAGCGRDLLLRRCSLIVQSGHLEGGESTMTAELDKEHRDSTDQKNIVAMKRASKLLRILNRQTPKV